jgi:hypothetical protein
MIVIILLVEKTIKKMTSSATKLGLFKELFKGISDFKILTLLWVSQSMLASRTACLNKCAEDNGHLESEDSTKKQRYGKLRRFFLSGAQENIQKGVFLLLLRLFPEITNGFLIIDRTHWELGKRRYNLLVIGILYQGIFFPLSWKDLGRKGNSKWDTQLELLDELIAWWSSSGKPLPQLFFTGDREFIHHRLIEGLQSRQISFVLRLKEGRSFQLWHKKGIREKKTPLKTLQRFMQMKHISKVEVIVGGTIITNLTIVPNVNKESPDKFIYLITNLDDVAQAALFYRKRWKIECCFKHLKSGGFDLEAVSVKQPHQIHILFACLVLVYAMAAHCGIIAENEKPAKTRFFKKQNTHYPEVATLRHGIAILKDLTRNFDLFIDCLVSLIDAQQMDSNLLREKIILLI